MMIPDFSDVPLERHDPKPLVDEVALAEWATRVAAETGHTPNDLARDTPEQISVPALATAADHDELDFLQTWPGAAPYLRGPYPTMYASQPWTVRQYAGYSTAEESNAFYLRNLA
ncbi:MAG TPA: methylmalonyl-CoA mutase, partial [Acidimicrobiaceae bacterium]|nr:methylmalonyl-CoA mutase [Acidimicrobiaceae bacterium]